MALWTAAKGTTCVKVILQQRGELCNLWHVSGRQEYVNFLLMIGHSRSRCGREAQLSSALIGNQALQGRLMQQLGRLCLGTGQECGQGQLLECPQPSSPAHTASHSRDWSQCSGQHCLEFLVVFSLRLPNPSRVGVELQHQLWGCTQQSLASGSRSHPGVGSGSTWSPLQAHCAPGKAEIG